MNPAVRDRRGFRAPREFPGSLDRRDRRAPREIRAPWGRLAHRAPKAMPGIRVLPVPPERKVHRGRAETWVQPAQSVRRAPSVHRDPPVLKALTGRKVHLVPLEIQPRPSRAPILMIKVSYFSNWTMAAP